MTSYKSQEKFHLELLQLLTLIIKQIHSNMGQFVDYLTNFFSQTPSKVASLSANNKSDNNVNHVTFADSSFSQVFGGSKQNEAHLQSLIKSNQRTIYLYQAIGALSCLIHLFAVTMPKVRLDSFDIIQPDGWQLVTLSVVPMVVYSASVSAMYVVNKPLLEGVKLTSKNSTGLDLNANEFIYSLKIVILLMALSQVSCIFSDLFIWSAVMIVPFWCYQLTSRVSASEYKRYSPNPKKNWVNLNLSRSPKSSSPIKIRESPVKQTPVKQPKQPQPDDNGVKATPRTRTRRAVRNIINNVSDKYHAFEQNVAHQLTQKVFNPNSPTKLKAIE